MSKRLLNVVICLSLLFVLGPSVRALSNTESEILAYPFCSGLPTNNDFSVKVRTPGQPWHDIPTCRVRVTAGINLAPPTANTAPGQNKSTPPSGPEDSSIGAFDFHGSVIVAVTYNKGTLQAARIRPLSYGIKAEQSKNTITFTLSTPRNLSIEVNGDTLHNLHLFANPMEAFRPNPDDQNVIYFGPGHYRAGAVVIPSGKTVYLAPGAVVEGSFLIHQASDVRILGRGILCHNLAAQNGVISALPKNLPTPQPGESRRRDAILIEYSKNVEIDGLTIIPNSYTALIGQSENVTLKNIKSFSAGGNNDGIDVFSSTDVLIDSAFLRNSDDNIAIYGHRWNYYGDTRHVAVQNSTLWADVAHPILVGTHGNSEKPETLEELTFKNIDILEHREPQLDYQGCLSLNAGDSNLIRRVRFDDIRVEDFQRGQLLNLRVFYNRKYNTSPGRGIEDVLFRNVTYTGTNANLSIIAGYDPSHKIKSVIFEKLIVNGREISDHMPGKPGFYKTSDMANIFIGEHAEDIAFRNQVSGQ